MKNGFDQYVKYKERHVLFSLYTLFKVFFSLNSAFLTFFFTIIIPGFITSKDIAIYRNLLSFLVYV